ncbi:unnamed protein product [Adineta ricciae]|uniref:Uncharacterized protein n=1 Tax=Adineta ricciae TaxID=249248 RepID=A0A815X7Y5_ADIRI|nr:unnamed protein product [Adineta ricciae]
MASGSDQASDASSATVASDDPPAVLWTPTTIANSKAICSSTVKKSGDSTFNFICHVKRHHMNEYTTWLDKLALKEEKILSQKPDIKTAMTSPRGTRHSSDHSRQIELSRVVTHDLII